MKTYVIYPVLLLVMTLVLASCLGGVNGEPEPRPSSVTNINAGRRLIAGYGCGSCHSIPGVPGADAMAAPPLNCFYQRSYIAGRLANTKKNLVRWIENPQQVEPGTAMPDLGVDEEDASNIADYLYQQPTRWGISLPLERKCSP